MKPLKEELSFEPTVTDENFIDLLDADPTQPIFANETEKALFLQAKYGTDVLDFLNTEAGRMIRTLVKEDIRDNTMKLKSVAPWRKRRITELQNKIQQGETWLFYLADLIQRGEHAYIQLQSLEESN